MYKARKVFKWLCSLDPNDLGMFEGHTYSKSYFNKYPMKKELPLPLDMMRKITPVYKVGLPNCKYIVVVPKTNDLFTIMTDLRPVVVTQVVKGQERSRMTTVHNDVRREHHKRPRKQNKYQIRALRQIRNTPIEELKDEELMLTNYEKWIR